jgi:hypothetical protein
VSTVGTASGLISIVSKVEERKLRRKNTMNDFTSERGRPVPEDAALELDGELVNEGWPVIAAVAWQGYLTEGRGVVMIDYERRAAYCRGALGECDRYLVDTYDPELEVVVAVVDCDEMCTRSIHLIAGWPAPPDAFRITPAERSRLTAH